MSTLGYKISELDIIPLTGKDCEYPGRIAIENTHFMGYAHTVFGTRYNTHNYRIPLSALRDDFKGYIGIESVNGKWTTPTKLWSGKWEDNHVNTSYIKVWEHDEYNHPYYNADKFKDLEHTYYIVQDLPYPFEENSITNRTKGEKEAIIDDALGLELSINKPIAAADPYPNSHKIPTKAYVDERLASKRIIEVGTDFYVRDYECTYIIRADDIKNASVIKIHYPKEFETRLLHNRIEFNILIEGVETEGGWKSAADGREIIWELYNGDTLLNDKLIWLGNSNNTLVNYVIGQSGYYGNARYIKFRLETVTNHNEVVDDAPLIIDDKTYDRKKVVPDYCIYLSCENLLYKAAEVDVNITSDGTISISGNSKIGYTLSTTHTSVKAGALTKVSKNGSTYTVESKLNAGSGININSSTGEISTNLIAGDNISISGNKISANIPPLPDIPEETEIESTDTSLLEVNKENGVWKLAPKVKNLTISAANNYITLKPGTNSYSIGFDETKLYGNRKTIAASTTLSIHSLDTTIYYSSVDNLTLKLDFTNSNAATAAKQFTLIYSPTSDSKIVISNTNYGSKSITTKWAMKKDSDISPTFIGGRTYSITFTYITKSENNALLIGAIDWFTY